MAVSPTTGRARLQIDPKCQGLIAELGGGRSPVPGGGFWRMRGGIPESRNDHACKALGYGLVAYLGTAHVGSGSPGVDDDEPGDMYSYLEPARKHISLTELLARHHA